MIVAALRPIRAAFVFLTRLPIGGFPYSADEFRWAPAHFPLVGLAVGGLGALLLVTAAPLGPLVASILAVATLVGATGAFHEDGLADTADALGGPHERAKIFAILKDSRVGTYGAAALALSLLLRAACLAELTRRLGTGWGFALAPNLAGDVASLGASAPGVLMVSQCLSRSGPVCLMAVLPYVTAESAKSSAVARDLGAPQVACTLGWAALGLSGAVWLGLPVLLASAFVVVTIAVTASLGRWFKRRLGGYTGDFLGALQQALDMALLLCALSWAAWGGRTP